MSSELCVATAVLAVGFVFYMTYQFCCRTLSKLRVSAKGRIVVITGCDQGFGAMTAKLLYDMGCTVFATCLLDKSVAAYNEQYPEDSRFFAVQMDVASEESRVSTILNSLGTSYIDVLINNAGIWIGSHTEFTSMAVYRKSMDVNYFGMIHVTKAFLPLIKASPSSHRRILNVCSIAGRMSSHSTGAYSASKFAAEAFTIALRQEMREWGIKVCMYEPGFHGTALLSLFKNNLAKSYEQSPESVKAEYGTEYLEKQMKSFDWMKKICVNHPENVVLALVEGTLSKFPKTRYVVGLDAKYLFAPTVTLLPDAVVDFALSKVLSLKPPAALRKRDSKYNSAPINPSS
eukprot:TRINITY_DN943_c0_g1_i1.p1 TRINITY_DN943_c0_g1~~TRINITY_DN943_c0_g1_i1.p1  ORF type:complete len:345 (-),score=104.33 TRINITY_DN943_c0_g1_i1:36-1070(-)